jgi:hypothetical protein
MPSNPILAARREHLPMILLLLAATVVGALFVPHYGLSWDEPDIHRYSDYAIGAYRFLLHPATLPKFDTNLNLYGPGYYLAANLLARCIMAIHPAWSSTDAWHLVYFLTFLAGSLVLYLLARRWMSTLSAFGTALLFISQPLLWGHAFINPKDTPFMVFFAGTVYAGFKMTDDYRSSGRPTGTFPVAAALLGLTSSFRVLGPLAGIIVLGYAAVTLRKKAIGLAATYLFLAALVAYLTWPYLWSSPLSHYLESMQTMAQFPFASNILFDSQVYKATDLPWTYFPTFLGIQLTESALALMGIGLVIALLQAVQRRRAGPLILFAAWFLVPALLIVSTRNPLYDNARQLFFLLPPLFLIAGIALERLFGLLTQPVYRGVALVLMALPGILLTIRLHPYEYVYYNALVGGTGGAYRRFEMDYWGTSFREIAQRLNSSAAPGARVLVFGPDQILAPYTRPDIRVFAPEVQSSMTYDYAVFQTRANLDERHCRDAETLFSVERRGAVFSILKKIPDGSECK